LKLIPARTALLVAVITVTCLVSIGREPHRQDASLTKVEEAGVSFAYDAGDFGAMTVREEKRWTAQDVGDGVPEGLAPAHRCFDFEAKRLLPALDKGARYFFPSNSFVCFIPLADTSVENFGKAYPFLADNTRLLHRLLRAMPQMFGRLNKFGKWDGIPDEPLIQASLSLRAKPQYLVAPSIVGILFLTQHSQDTGPSPANNEELIYNFQGATKDGKYYVAAHFAVTHPSLPKGIDFIDQSKIDKQWHYLRRDEATLNRLNDISFQPSLVKLRALLSSISVK
jgi:hypothetical protein